MRPPKQEQGFALVALVSIVSGAMLFLMSGFYVLTQKHSGAARTDARAAYLIEARTRIADVYANHLASFDAGPSPDAIWTEETILDRAGITPKYRLRVQVGARQIKGDLAYRNFYLWLPPMGAVDTTSYEPVSDSFQPAAGAQWTSLGGRDIAAQALAETRNRLSQARRALVMMYAARLADDAFHDASVNYWLSESCDAAHGGGDIPCPSPGSFWDARAQSDTLDRVAGLNSHMLSDAWGGPLMIANTAPQARTGSPPYSLVLRAVAPWGRVLEELAVEPL